MKDEDLYAAIFKRKSVRNFDLTALDQNVLDEIWQKLGSLEPMSPDIKTEFKIVPSEKVSTRIMKRAPHYVAAFSEAKGAYASNVGFLLQQMDLYFSASGFGSCWQGIPRPAKDVVESSNLEFVILMAFGNPSETLHRASASEFKRKPLSEITDIQGADELLEPARLAPSAVNRQNWYFTGDKTVVHAYSFKPGFLRNLLEGKYFPINVGIAMYHLQLAAKHFGRKATVVFEEEKEKNPTRDRDYIASLKIENP